jgi:putative copper export protein
MISWFTFSLLLHLIALALWLGGIAFFLIVFGPAVHELTPGIGIRVLNRGRIAFEAVSWAAIGLLLITGIINLILQSRMTGVQLGQYYVGILSIKLLLFLAMLIHHFLQVFKYGPKIVTLTSQADAQSAVWPEPLRTHWEKWFMLLKINATLGPIVTFLGLALVKS